MFARRFAVQTIPEKRVVIMQKSPTKGKMVAVMYSLLRKEGLKLFLQHKKPKDDEGKYLQPDKRLMTPSEAHTTSKKISDSDLHPIGLCTSGMDGPYSHTRPSASRTAEYCS
ncbi:hypothetical protein PM082_020095 [Marasmius tenuissimus]|nr:hypothetical protein PM082_020095 [Marasmius tenuissimus]